LTIIERRCARNDFARGIPHDRLCLGYDACEASTMRIQDRPEYKSKSSVFTLTPDDYVITAVKAMSERNYGAVVVVDPANKPVGIVTERDFMRRLLNKALDPQTTKLKEIMTTELKVAKSDDNLLDWLRQMSNDRFRHLPIVDDHGTVISMMSQGDFVSYTWPQLLSRLGEQARATFELSPSLFVAFGGAMFFMMSILVYLVAIR
jgi:CBS domain-containing protein